MAAKSKTPATPATKTTARSKAPRVETMTAEAPAKKRGRLPKNGKTDAPAKRGKAG